MRRQLKKKALVTAITAALLAGGALSSAMDTQDSGNAKILKNVQQLDINDRYFAKNMQFINFINDMQTKTNKITQDTRQNNILYWRQLADDDEFEKIEDDIDKVKKRKNCAVIKTNS